MSDPQKVQFKEKTFSEKCAHIFKNISVEPTLVLYVTPAMLAALATQNLFLEKACRTNLGFDDEICDALTARNTANYTAEEKSVQSIVATLQGWKTVFQSLLPCLFILFWGSYSDRHGRRKVCMIVPIVGEILSIISLIFNTYFKAWPMEVAGVSEVIFPGLSGSWFLMFIGIYSYIADNTPVEERTFRIGIVNIFFSISFPIGMGLSGVLLKKFGFYGVFGTSVTILTIDLLYTLFFIKDQHIKHVVTKKNFIVDFFDTEHVKNTFKVAFKKTEDNRRKKVMAVLTIAMLLIGPLHGEIAVTYLFTRFKFNWSEVEYSILSTYSMALQMVGIIIAVSYFSKKLKMRDSIIGLIAAVSKIFSSFMYCFAANGRQFFIGPIIELFKEAGFISMRSISSKLVKPDELGKINSLIGIAEGLMPLIFAPMYTQLYRATIEVLPGAFYLLGGACTLPLVAIFLWLNKVQKEDEQKIDEESKANKNPEAMTLLASFGSKTEVSAR